MAENDGIQGVILSGHDGRRGFFYHTAVHHDARGQGIGTALLVFRRNEGGNAFWEKQGFTVRDDLAYRNLALRTLVRQDT